MIFQGGPGGWTFAVGVLVLCVYLVGGAVATTPGMPNPAFWWVALGLFGVDVFVASVVAAYHAGKKRR